MKNILSAIIAAATAIGAFIGITACGSAVTSNLTLSDTMNTPPEKNDSIKPSYSSGDIKDMLEKLAKTPVKEKLNMGAMCYAKVQPSDTSPYICPVCGEKTIYQQYDNAIIRLQIPACRSIVRFYPEMLSIDETQFCKKCTPELKGAPKICLIVKLKDQPEHKTCDVREDDLELLSDFFHGKTEHTYEDASETPMQDQIPRIKYLLGLEKQ